MWYNEKGREGTTLEVKVRGNGFTWEDLGLPKVILPAPFPFLPLPRGLIMKVEGLGEYEAYALVDSIVKSLGTVWGVNRDEAIEAAENLAEVSGTRFSSVGVIPK